MLSTPETIDLYPIPVTPEVNLDFYDRFIVTFSGGKDSLACLLLLLDLGIPREKIELWHHLVDGRPDDGGVGLFDWPCTESYVRAIGKAFDIPVYFSWLDGGMEGEMLRDGTPKNRTFFETPDGLFYAGGDGELGRRLHFPLPCADLKKRWCSAYLKNHVGAIALRNQPRFKDLRTIFITGERAQESTKRRGYSPFQVHETACQGRHVDHWRPALSLLEEDVWGLIQKYLVNPHPAYRIGFGRVSCQFCIFGSDNQWATLRLIDPERFERIAQYEWLFQSTIQNKVKLPFEQRTIHARADRGTPYGPMDPFDIEAALNTEFDEPIILTPDTWSLPSGAFGESTGPS